MEEYTTNAGLAIMHSFWSVGGEESPEGASAAHGPQRHETPFPPLLDPSSKVTEDRVSKAARKC